MTALHIMHPAVIALTAASVIGAYIFGLWSGRAFDRLIYVDRNRDAQRWNMVEEMREEDATVILFPDKDTGSMMSVSAPWTNGEYRDYSAASIDVCIAQAYKDAME